MPPKKKSKRSSGEEPPIKPVAVALKDWPAHAKRTLEEIERSERLTAADMAVTINARPPEEEVPAPRFPWQKELRERAKRARAGEQITAKDLGIVVR